MNKYRYIFILLHKCIIHYCKILPRVGSWGYPDKYANNIYICIYQRLTWFFVSISQNFSLNPTWIFLFSVSTKLQLFHGYWRQERKKWIFARPDVKKVRMSSSRITNTKDHKFPCFTKTSSYTSTLNKNFSQIHT